jgi:hypothetical protein
MQIMFGLSGEYPSVRNILYRLVVRVGGRITDEISLGLRAKCPNVREIIGTGWLFGWAVTMQIMFGLSGEYPNVRNILYRLVVRVGGRITDEITLGLRAKCPNVREIIGTGWLFGWAAKLQNKFEMFGPSGEHPNVRETVGTGWLLGWAAELQMK